MSHAHKYTDDKAAHKYIPGAHGLFCERYSDKKLMLVAIKLSNGFVYTPPVNSKTTSTESEWLMAKIALNSAEGAWQNSYHFWNCHSNMEPIFVEMMRHVSVHHPVYQLMKHHYKNLFAQTVIGLFGLFRKGSDLDQFYGWGAYGFMAHGEGTKEATELDITRPINEDLSQRKVDKLKNNRFAESALKYDAAIRDFVKGFLDKTYPSDKDLQRDDEIQNWAKSVRDANGAAIQTFPSGFKTKSELANVLANQIYLLSIKHNALNNDAAWHVNAQPITPSAFWKDLPTSQGQKVDVRGFLAPTRELLSLHAVTTATFYRNVQSKHNLVTGVYAGSAVEKFAPEEVKKFRAKVKEIGNSANNLEKKVASPTTVQYSSMNPERCPYYSWI
eukprot:Nk52_evm10s216 gene=Nk52_evmTU10s216